MLIDLLRLLRPHHWVKNAFVVVPLPFAIAAGAQVDWWRFLYGLVGFSLVTSSVYVLNDIRDKENDQESPSKRERPIASGRVPIPLAWVMFAVFAGLGFAGCALSQHPMAIVLTLVYMATNIVYSFGLKHVALLDVFLLASGYVIRVLLGCALADVPPSEWLLLCTSGVALFLSFTKRRADVVAGLTPAHRPALAGYNAAFLELAMGITCGITLLAYALYSMDTPEFVTGRKLAGLPFVAFALLQYLRLACTENRGGSPVDVALRSPSLQLCAVAWLLVTVWSLGLL